MPERAREWLLPEVRALHVVTRHIDMCDVCTGDFGSQAGHVDTKTYRFSGQVHMGCLIG